MFTLLSASQTTLQSIIPIRNTKIAMHLFIQVCQGVMHLHRSNLCYGLINPSNIYLNEERLVTLGIRHLYEVNNNLINISEWNHDRAILYFPPENEFSQAGDVWSLSVLLHEMLTGELPFNI